ncbi:MAG: hypothetical protein IPL20_03905 [Saprospiraceae bacterium]|nr:hypothetical protein [Saprospiraceae bacterium]
MFKNVFFWFLLGLMAVSCGKDDGEDVPTTGSSTFSYKVEGKQVSVKGVNAYGFVFSDDSYGIYGISTDGSDENCYILVPKNTAVGEHVIKNDIKAYYINKTGETYITVFAEGGTLTIVKKDDVQVKGTFSFVAGDGNTPLKKVNITEGTFNVRMR